MIGDFGRIFRVNQITSSDQRILFSSHEEGKETSDWDKEPAKL